jgi:hypothetical protein
MNTEVMAGQAPYVSAVMLLVVPLVLAVHVAPSDDFAKTPLSAP